MKKVNLIIILCLLFNSVVHSQKEVLRINNKLKTTDSPIKKSFSIVDSKTSNLSIFLQDKKNMYGYLYNDSFELISELKSDNLARKYKHFIGSSINNGNHNLFLSNKQSNAFGMITFSFKNNKASIKEIDLDLETQTFLQSLSYDNTFYIFTVDDYSSILNVFIFDEKGAYTKKRFDFSDKKFLDKKNRPISLYRSLSKNAGHSSNLSIEKIDSNNPNSIESTSEKSKMYLKGNNVLITIDNSNNYTHVLEINLDDFSSKVNNIKKPFLNTYGITGESNSFIYNDILFQLVSTSDNLIFSATNLNTEVLLKEYKLNKKDSITFKNSPIIQDGGMYASYREMEKTKKFLRKITSGTVGIAVQKVDTKYQITLGGKKEVSSGASGFGGFGGFAMGSFGNTNMFFSPTVFAFNAYTNTVSTYINCLFDENINHIEGEISENVFDKISSFRKKKKKHIKAETIFKYKDKYLFGTCLGISKDYIVVEFDN